ncbi:hypothetical protein LCM4579_00755 [Ensifer sp. LCM 4579]|nr:hypothetical protein LCM4579_00755 [Ensifer sp. LCM 4579]
MMPAPLPFPVGHNAASRLERALSAAAIPIATLRAHDLTVAERSALLDCYATPDRLFVDIAAMHRVDRERLQDLWFDLFVQPNRPDRPKAARAEPVAADAAPRPERDQRVRT